MMHIVFAGLAGVPRLSRACDVRLAFFANLLARNFDVTILNRYSSIKKEVKMDVDLDKHILVKEIITPRSTGQLLSSLLYLFSVILEPIKILSINRKVKIDILHIYSSHYVDFLLYWIIGRSIGAKIVVQYVEYRSDHKRRMGNPYHKVNGYLCDFWGPKLWDGVIPISDFLQQKALEVNPKLKYLKVIPLCDFAIIEKNRLESPVDDAYLFYCGNVGYKWAIDLIIESYRRSVISKTVKLFMVLSGDSEKIKEQQRKYPDIVFMTRLDYNVLIACYKHAAGLFIPLKNEIREIARFPNKICEYLASHGLIITTDVGEMKNYFEDGVNAIVSEGFSVDALSSKLDILAGGGYDVEKIKTNAYRTGLDYFDINSYSNKVTNFFEAVKK